MNFYRLTRKDFIQHLLTWIVLSFFLQAIDPVIGSLLTQVVEVSLIMFNYMFAYYSLFLVILPRIWINKKILAVLAVVPIYLTYTFFQYLSFYKIAPLVGAPTPDKVFLQALMLNTLLTFSVVAFVAFSSYTRRFAMEKIRIQNEREKTMIVRELSFLKNQFNSHLTFNFLNFVYSKVHQSSEAAAESIELFSNMLRYSLKIKPSDPVPLRKEVDYITDFISLHKQLSNSVFVDFTTEGLNDEILILPRILITFVENAFKHGQTSNPEHPIRIRLEVQSSQIRFTVSNKKNTLKKVEVSGIGKENVQQLLELYYTDKYSLKVEEDTEDYSTALTLTL